MDPKWVRSFLTIIGSIMFLLPLFTQFKPNYWNLPEELLEWYKDAFLNMGAGLLGSVLIITLYDGLIHEKEEKVRLEKQQYALRQLNFYFADHLQLIISMYKSVINHPPNVDWTDLATIFDESFFNSIRELELYGLCGTSGKKWYSVIAERRDTFYKNGCDIVARYLPYFDTDMLSAIEDVLNSNWMKMIPSLEGNIKYNSVCAPELEKFDYLTKEDRELFFMLLNKHVLTFIELIKHYNTISNKKLMFSNIGWDLSNEQFKQRRLFTTDKLIIVYAPMSLTIEDATLIFLSSPPGSREVSGWAQ